MTREAANAAGAGPMHDGPATSLESEVRSYCRAWPTEFDCGHDSRLRDRNGRWHLDFSSGAGALNYGHNHPVLKQALLSYLERDGVIHSLDMTTSAKTAFLEEFRRLVWGLSFQDPTLARV